MGMGAWMGTAMGMGVGAVVGGVDVLLVAGGGGVTPLHSIFRTLLLLRAGAEGARAGAGAGVGGGTGGGTEGETASREHQPKHQPTHQPTQQPSHNRVRLLWATRHPGSFALFAHTWVEATGREGFSVSFHCTAPGFKAGAGAGVGGMEGSMGASGGGPPSPLPGRPNLGSELDWLMGAGPGPGANGDIEGERGGAGGAEGGAARGQGGGRGRLCLVCGPASLVDEVQRGCADRGIECRAESFVL